MPRGLVRSHRQWKVPSDALKKENAYTSYLDFERINLTTRVKAGLKGVTVGREIGKENTATIQVTGDKGLNLRRKADESQRGD